MCNNGFWGGNSCMWIIILLILFCGCGNTGFCGTGYGNNGCGGYNNNGCGCGCDRSNDCCC